MCVCVCVGGGSNWLYPSVRSHFDSCVLVLSPDPQGTGVYLIYGMAYGMDYGMD